MDALEWQTTTNPLQLVAFLTGAEPGETAWGGELCKRQETFLLAAVARNRPLNSICLETVKLCEEFAENGLARAEEVLDKQFYKLTKSMEKLRNLSRHQLIVRQLVSRCCREKYSYQWDKLLTRDYRGEADIVRDVTENMYNLWPLPAVCQGCQCLFTPAKARFYKCPRCNGSGPFTRKAVWPPEWATAVVRNQAKAVYASACKQSGRLDLVSMQVLADAVEETGCDHQDLLNHLRGRTRCYCRGGKVGPSHGNEEMCGGSGWVKLPPVHVKGCIAIETLLGRL